MARDKNKLSAIQQAVEAADATGGGKGEAPGDTIECGVCDTPLDPATGDPVAAPTTGPAEAQSLPEALPPMPGV